MKKLYPVSLIASVTLIVLDALLLKRTRRIENPPAAKPASSFAHVASSAPQDVPPAKPASTEPGKTMFQQIAAGEKPMGRVLRPTGPAVTGRDGLLTDEITRMAGLSADERAGIDQLLKNTRKQYDDLLGRHATASVSTDGKIEVRADPFVDEGRQLCDLLERSIKQRLGNERAAQFMSVAGDGVERAFGNFGASVRLLQIFRTPPDEESLESRITVFETDQYGTGTLFRGRTFNNVAALVSQYPTITDKIPSHALRALEPQTEP